MIPKSAPSSDDVLVLSPHLDDGVLSCGGTIQSLTRAGRRVVVATLFSGDVGSQPLSPFAQRVFHFMGLDPATGMASRRQEDLRACSRLGAKAIHYSHLEAIVRTPSSRAENLSGAERGESPRPCPYDSMATLFGPPESEDAHRTVQELATTFESLRGFGHWLAPASIGGHVDHRLVRSAVLAFLGLGHAGDDPSAAGAHDASEAHDRDASAHRPALWFYEDYPYARRRRARWRVLGPPWGRRQSATVHPLTEDDLAAKVAAITEYTSQVEPLFGAPTALESALRRSARRIGGERFWTSPETLNKWPRGPSGTLKVP